MSRTAAIALAFGSALLACAAPPASEEAPRAAAVRPNVVLVSIDTLRSDRLPAYGYDGVETPAIDRLAGQGVLFERAYTHVNVTLPSHASLFTGLLPSEHDLRDNAGYRLDAAARRLRAALEAIDRSLGSPAEDDPETRRRLESLGYLSGGARAADGPLPDPKSRIGVVDELARAARLGAAGELAEAESALRSVLESEPQLVLAWHELGGILERRGRPLQALDAYRRAFEVSGGDASGAGIKVAELLLRTGRVAEAREHALAVADRSPLASQVLAEAALVEGDLEEAERRLVRALAERGPRVAPLIVRAGLLNAQGRFEEALTQSDEVLAEFGDRGDRSVLARLYLHRGTALGALDRAEEAERSYRQAIGLDKELLGGYSALAFLFAVEGRAADAGRTLQEMVTVNPAQRG